MTNLTHFIDFHDKRTLMVESFHELAQFFTPELIKVLEIFFLLLIGWLFTVVFVLLLIPFLPLKLRSPAKEVFFAEYSEKIRKNFRHQTEETFQTILMGTCRILKKNTEDPTVFLLLAPQGAMPTALRLVYQLIHSILAACCLSADLSSVEQVILDGNKYRSHDDEWPFFLQVKRYLKFYGVAAVLSFESLHPQVVKSMQLLLAQLYSPCPESVLILVADLRNQFTEHQKKNLSPNSLGRIFLQDHLGPYFDRTDLSDTIKRLGCRCVLVNPEPSC